MTQYNEAVEKQKEVLEMEKKANSVVCMDIRFKDGKWTEQTIDYADGRRVTEYRDKRKAKTVENMHGKD